jgi:arylsulfatase A-like enzyme
MITGFSRRAVGRFLALFAAVLGLATAAGAAADRPNLVLILADDMAWDDCGAYGHKTLRTPNIDRLAREGMRFDRAFLTCSSCSPSRSSIITGRYPHNTDAEQLHWPLPKEQVTFVEKLKAAGYWTAAAGKWHLGEAVKGRFDVVHEAGTAGFQLPSGAGAPAGKMIQDKDESGCGQWVPTLQSRPKDKPFFLWLAAFDPHRDYQTNAIPVPHGTADVVVPPYLPDVPEVRRDLALYYDEITRLDGNIGRVLDELDRQGVATNTLVLFLSDNGRPFPRCKTTVYDSGIRTPFLVRWPGHVKPGSVCASLVSSVDIAPGFLELAGLPVAPGMQGWSFVRLLSKPQAKIRDHVFAEHNWHDFDALGRAVRTERFKYIRNLDPELPNTPPADAVRSPTFVAMRRLRDKGLLTQEKLACFTVPKPAEEFYDLATDPHELRNVLSEPRYARVLDELRAELDKWQRDTRDPVPAVRAKDEFNRETGDPLPNRQRPRPSKQQLLATPK